MAYGVVRTDNMYGTDVRAALVSVEYLGADGETETAIENGNVLELDGLKDGEREIFVGKAPTAASEMKDVVLVASPEVMYEATAHNLDEFINKAGVPARGYRLHQGDIFSVTKDALDGVEEPAVGNIVELKAGTKLNVAESLTQDSTKVGEIIAIDVVGRYTYYVILVG